MNATISSTTIGNLSDIFVVVDDSNKCFFCCDFIRSQEQLAFWIMAALAILDFALVIFYRVRDPAKFSRSSLIFIGVLALVPVGLKFRLSYLLLPYLISSAVESVLLLMASVLLLMFMFVGLLFYCVLCCFVNGNGNNEGQRLSPATQDPAAAPDADAGEKMMDDAMGGEGEGGGAQEANIETCMMSHAEIENGTFLASIKLDLAEKGIHISAAEIVYIIVRVLFWPFSVYIVWCAYLSMK